MAYWGPAGRAGALLPVFWGQPAALVVFLHMGGSSHALTPLLIQCQPCPEAPLPVAFKAGCPRKDYRSRHAASLPAPAAALAGRVLQAGRQGGMLQQDGRQARPGGGGGLSSGSPAADHAPLEKWPGAPCAAPPGEGQGRPVGNPLCPIEREKGRGCGWGPVSPRRGCTRSRGCWGGEEGCPRLAQERTVRALGKRGSEKGLWGLTREATVSETCPVSFVPPHPRRWKDAGRAGGAAAAQCAYASGIPGDWGQSCRLTNPLRARSRAAGGRGGAAWASGEGSPPVGGQAVPPEQRHGGGTALGLRAVPRSRSASGTAPG